MSLDWRENFSNLTDTQTRKLNKETAGAPAVTILSFFSYVLDQFLDS